MSTATGDSKPVTRNNARVQAAWLSCHKIVNATSKYLKFQIGLNFSASMHILIVMKKNPQTNTKKPHVTIYIFYNDRKITFNRTIVITNVVLFKMDNYTCLIKT